MIEGNNQKILIRKIISVRYFCYLVKKRTYLNHVTKRMLRKSEIFYNVYSLTHSIEKNKILRDQQNEDIKIKRSNKKLSHKQKFFDS